MILDTLPSRNKMKKKSLCYKNKKNLWLVWGIMNRSNTKKFERGKISYFSSNNEEKTTLEVKDWTQKKTPLIYIHACILPLLL